MIYMTEESKELLAAITQMMDERFEQVDEMERRLVFQWKKDIYDSENLLLEEMESNYKKIEEHYVKKAEIA